MRRVYAFRFTFGLLLGVGGAAAKSASADNRGLDTGSGRGTRLALAPSGKATFGGRSEDSMQGRRAVRGTSVEAHETPELRAMREFEADRFGRARKRDMGDENSADPRDEEKLRAAAIAEFGDLAAIDIPVRFEPRLVRFLEFYKNERRGHAIMSTWLKRQGRYRELIESALERHHLPHALLYVAMIESGYDPHDRSSAGAAGVWQFMPEGGRIYGLRIDHWVDERLDPEKSTEAVMRYFADLHSRFGSWHLALGAFNAGYGAALASIAKYNTNDYWALSNIENGLPWETVLYVPKALAAAIVGQNRESFGYGGLEPDPPFAYDRVSVPPATTLANVAQAAGVTQDQVVQLNPELVRDRTPPRATGEAWSLRLPRGTGPRFLEHFEAGHERVKTHVVGQGERIESIAKSAHCSVAELKRINAIRDIVEVRPGATLILPGKGAEVVGSDNPSTGRKGETRKGASAKPEGPAALLHPDDEGPVLVALTDRDRLVEGQKRLFYRVAPGDGLGEVARYFGVREADLARWNRIDPDARLIGSQVLEVWVAPDFDPRSAALDPAHLKLVTVGSDGFWDAVEEKKGRRRLLVSAHDGDTMKRIGARYGLSEADMERINRIPRTSALKAGQELVVYVPLDKSRGRDGGKPRAPGEGEAGTALLRRVGTKVKTDDVPASALPQPPPCDDPSFPAEDAGTADKTTVRLPTLPSS